MTEFANNGLKIIEGVFTDNEINEMLSTINKSGIRKAFGVRRFLPQVPELLSIIANDKLKEIVHGIAKEAVIIRSIYFDKPPAANWLVNWHQDLTINVNGRIEHPEYLNWRMLQDRTVVQPPLKYLENIFTVRIHLDDCTEKNGALRVLKGSHKNGVAIMKEFKVKTENEVTICEVKRGGIILMKPLLLHASRRAENDLHRRVIHIEFCDKHLPDGMEWNEKMNIFGN